MKPIENSLTKEQKQSIRTQYAKGKSIKDIARSLGISERKVERNIPMKLLITNL